MARHCGARSPDGVWYCTARMRGHAGEHVADYVDPETDAIHVAHRWFGRRRWWEFCPR